MSSENQRLNSSSDLRSRSCFILDLDGVVYAGQNALPGAVEAIEKFRKAGKRVAFLTNNSRQPARVIQKKLHSLGIPCADEELINSGQATIELIKERQVDSGQGVYVIGTEELKEEFIRCGITLTSPRNCGALVACMHQFTYQDVAEGLVALSRGVPFIACNQDANYPVDNGEIKPGCGALVGALEGTSLRRVDYVVGKPNTLMLEILMHRLGVQPEECLIFGDHLDSDVQMANKAGIPAVWISPTNTPENTPPHQQPQLRTTSLLEALSYVT